MNRDELVEAGARAIVALDHYVENEWEVFIPDASAVVEAVEAELAPKIQLLIDALERRDPEGARAALVADLRDANDVYRPFSTGVASPEGAAARSPRRKPVAA